MEIIHETETLQEKAKTGKTKYWKKQVLRDGETISTRSVFWQEGSEPQFAAPTKIEGKNLGRANETKPLEQAMRECAAEFKKKQDKGYSVDGVTDLLLKPMLAHEYKKHHHKLPDRVFVDTKYDGVRCLLSVVDGKVKAWSRQGKEFGPHITALFEDLGLPGIVDGELMLPLPHSFEETVSAVKKGRPLTQLLEYLVYDIVDDAPFSDRHERLSKLPTHSHLKVAPRVLVNKSEVEELFNQALASGHEGVMVRHPDAKYEADTRSYALQKFKGWDAQHSEEFTIVDVKEGEGREAGKAIFVCTTGQRTFNVRPKGTMEYRAQLWAEKDLLIGKFLTVEFQNLTVDNVPRFPIGIAVRDYE